jgi:hypothetical protein
MTERDHPKHGKKSTPDLVVLPRSNDNSGKKSHSAKKTNYRIASAMTGINFGWPPFPTKLHRWTDHQGVSVPYVETTDGIVKKISDDGIRHLIADYWDNVLTQSEQPIFLDFMSAEALERTRKLWLAMAKPVQTKFLTLGWKSETRISLHKMDFDPFPVPDPESACPLFCELMGRTTNNVTLMAWIGSLFDPQSQRQQYAWIYGAGENGKSALARVLLAALGPVGASEKPPTQDAKHWTCGLSNKRLVVFPDCNNVSFVTSGDFKQLTGEDPVRMEPKGKPVHYEDIDAKFLIISNDRPRISSSKADMRRILFFSIADIPPESRFENYEHRLAIEMPAIMSLCWETYQLVSRGDPRHRFMLSDKSEVQALVADTEHEMEAFVAGKLCVLSYDESHPKNKRNFVAASVMLDLMNDCGFKTRYERQKLREYMQQAHGIVAKKIKCNGLSKLVYLNCFIGLPEPNPE